MRGVRVKIVTKKLVHTSFYIPGKPIGQAIAWTAIVGSVLLNLAGPAALSQPDDKITRSAATNGLRDDETTDTTNQTPAAAVQPALNVVTPPIRQPLAAPPETPQDSIRGAQSIALQKGAAPVSLPQSWRLKAVSLFKGGSVDAKNSNIMATKLASPYRGAFEAVRKAMVANNLTIEALSLSAGHILISSPNPNANLGANASADTATEKAIIALRQSASGDGTEVRVLCEAKNRALTMAVLRPIFDRLSAGDAYPNNRSGANSL